MPKCKNCAMEIRGGTLDPGKCMGGDYEVVKQGTAEVHADGKTHYSVDYRVIHQYQCCLCLPKSGVKLCKWCTDRNAKFEAVFQAIQQFSDDMKKVKNENYRNIDVYDRVMHIEQEVSKAGACFNLGKYRYKVDAQLKPFYQYMATIKGLTDLFNTDHGKAYLAHRNFTINISGLLGSITELPEIPGMENSGLVELDISNNKRLNKVPQEMFVTCSTLKSLKCAGCLRLNSPPVEVSLQGGEQTMHYLRSLHKEGDVNKDSVLCVIGDGQGGKTSALRAMMSADNKISNTGGSDGGTVGIVLDRWDVSGSDLSFDVMDFAGQTLYSATHQYFLVKRGVYLLVWRAHALKNNVSDTKFLETMEDTKGMVISWLKQLVYQVPGVQFICAVTHIELCSDAMLKKQIQYVKNVVNQELFSMAMIAQHSEKREAARGRRKSMSDVEDVSSIMQVIDGGSSYPISPLTGEGIAELRRRIVEAAKESPFYGEAMPKTFLKLQARLKEMNESTGRPYIDWREYLDACAEVGVSKTMIRVATEFLNDMGRIRYFGNITTSSKDAYGDHQSTKDSPDDLRNKVFISPAWIIDVLKGLVRHDHYKLFQHFNSKRTLTLPDDATKKRLESMEEHAKKLLVRGSLHKDLIPYLWPCCSDRNAFSSDVAFADCQNYWTSAPPAVGGGGTPRLAAIGGGGESGAGGARPGAAADSAWGGRKVVSTKDDLDAAMLLLEGFLVISTKKLQVEALGGGVLEYHVPMLIPGHRKNVSDEPGAANTEMGNLFFRQFFFPSLPAAMPLNIVTRILRISAHGDISPNRSTFYSKGTLVEMTVAEDVDIPPESEAPVRKAARITLISTHRSQLDSVCKELRLVKSSYPGLPQLFVADNLTDITEPILAGLLTEQLFTAKQRYVRSFAGAITPCMPVYATNIVRARRTGKTMESVTEMKKDIEKSLGEDNSLPLEVIEPTTPPMVRVVLVAVDDKLLKRPQAISILRAMEENGADIIPLVTDGYTMPKFPNGLDDWKSWYPKALEDLFSRHHIPIDMRTPASVVEERKKILEAHEEESEDEEEEDKSQHHKQEKLRFPVFTPDPQKLTELGKELSDLLDTWTGEEQVIKMCGQEHKNEATPPGEEWTVRCYMCDQDPGIDEPHRYPRRELAQNLAKWMEKDKISRSFAALGHEKGLKNKSLSRRTLSFSRKRVAPDDAGAPPTVRCSHGHELLVSNVLRVDYTSPKTSCKECVKRGEVLPHVYDVRDTGLILRSSRDGWKAKVGCPVCRTLPGADAMPKQGSVGTLTSNLERRRSSFKVVKVSQAVHTSQGSTSGIWSSHMLPKGGTSGHNSPMVGSSKGAKDRSASRNGASSSSNGPGTQKHVMMQGSMKSMTARSMNSQDILGPASGRIIDIVNSEVVISHYSDNAECRSLDILGRRLEVASDISVWIDRWDVASRTPSYHTAALGAIKRSNVFIVVISQDYIENQDCRDELAMAIESCKFIIPVLGAGWKGQGGSDWWKDCQKAEESSQALKEAEIGRLASGALSESTKIEWWMLENVKPIDMRDEFSANDKTLPVGGKTESTILQHVLSRFHEGAAISHAEEDQYLMWRKKHGWLVQGLEAATKPGVSEEELKGAVKKAFDEIDADGSGSIDKVELFHAMEKAAGAELDVHDMDKLFSQVDVDGSGSIDIEEFEKLIRLIGSEAGGAVA